MAKIFANGRWYTTKFSTSMYERHYQKRILHHAETLFPNYLCCQFGVDIVSNDYGGPMQPDLVLIDKSYRYWYVVEVELETDNFSHVEQQVKVFTSGNYGEEQIDYLIQRNHHLDSEKLKKLMTASQPEVVVLLPKIKPSWATSLLQYGCKFVVVEIFRSTDDFEVLRRDGDELRDEGEFVLTNLKYRGLKAFEIESPGNFDMSEPIVVIEYEGQLTRWRITQWGNTYMLMPHGAVGLELKPGLRMAIVRTPEGLLRFQDAIEA
jgi:hypothetical protein